MAMALRRGDKGKAVREVQGLINSKAGRLVLVADGDFGRNTEEAVKKFQTSVKLKNDGVVGAKTWTALHTNALTSKFTNHAPVHDWFSLIELEKFFSSLPINDHAKAAPEQKPAHTSASKPAAVTHPVNKPSASPTSNVVSIPSIVKKSDYKGFRRISFHGYDGLGYVINAFKKFERGAIQLLPKHNIIEPPAGALAGVKNECAQFVQYFGVPRTTTWRKGPRVCDFKPGELPEGTVVATLRDEKYYSDYSGRSHVGIYLSHDDYSTYLTTKNKSAGVTIMDQWNGVRIERRTKKYAADANADGNLLKEGKTWTDIQGVSHNKRVKWSEDGEEYYVLLTQS